MNNKEFTTALIQKTGLSTRESNQMMNALIKEISCRLEEEDTVMIQNFGSFEVKKKLERVLINPATKQKMLVPPKMSVNFKPAVSLKEKANR